MDWAGALFTCFRNGQRVGSTKKGAVSDRLSVIDQTKVVVAQTSLHILSLFRDRLVFLRLPHIYV